ncbi:hypothetical protein ACFL20_13355 [Spirochaetota bacterium]
MRKIIFVSVIIPLILINLISFGTGASKNETIKETKNNKNNNIQKNEDNKPSFLQVYITGSHGFLVSGKQTECFDEYCMVAPPLYSLVDYMVETTFGIKYFPFTYAGLNVSYTFWGLNYSYCEKDSEYLHTYEFSKINFGFLYRYYLTPRISLLGEIGMNYCWLKFADEFKGRLNDPIEGIARGPGCYLALGIDLYFIRYLVLGFSFNYTYYNTQFQNPKRKFDGHNVYNSIKVGFSL